MNATSAFRIPGLLLVAALTATTVACDDDEDVTDVEPDGTGQLTLVVTDSVGVTADTLPGDTVPGDTAAVSGTFDATFAVEVSEDGTRFIQVGQSSASIPLQSEGSTTVLSAVPVEAGRFSTVRVSIDEGRATLDPGTSIEGQTFASAITIEIGGDDRSVTVQRELSPTIDVQEGTEVQLELVLNSAQWLSLQAANEGAVADEAIQPAITINAAGGGTTPGT